VRKREKVLFYVHDDAYFVSHRLGLARHLANEGYEVVVATPAGDRCHEIRAAGLRHCAVVAGKTRNPFRMLAATARLQRLYRRERPDVLFHVSMRAALFGGLAARLAGCRNVVNLVTGLGYAFSSGGRLLRWAVEQAYRYCLRGRIIFQNPDDRDHFLVRGLCRSEDATVIPGSGVDVEAFSPCPEPGGTPTILFAARLLWDKGIGTLVEAGRLLRARGVPHRIVVAGRLDAENPSGVAESQMAEWAEEGVIEWVGFDRDMAQSLARCAVACLPSYYREGVPMSLLEAAACGRPIVTTDAPGCREVVEDGVTGSLVPVRDAKALANALARLLADPALRASLGAAGRKRARRYFSSGVVFARTLAFVRAPATLVAEQFGTSPAAQLDD